MTKLIATVVLTLSVVCAAQTSRPLPEYEAASLRLTDPGYRGGMIQGGPGSRDPTRIAWRGIPLSSLIMSAYNLRRSQLQYPGWMDATRIDLTAKLPEGTTKADAALMMQRLLAERFKLV